MSTVKNFDIHQDSVAHQKTSVHGRREFAVARSLGHLTLRSSQCSFFGLIALENAICNSRDSTKAANLYLVLFIFFCKDIEKVL